MEIIGMIGGAAAGAALWNRYGDKLKEVAAVLKMSKADLAKARAMRQQQDIDHGTVIDGEAEEVS